METPRQSEALARIVEQIVGCFTPDGARHIANMRADRELQSRINALAVKANQGQLTDQERAEYEDSVDAIDFIGILQAKARNRL